MPLQLRAHRHLDGLRLLEGEQRPRHGRRGIQDAQNERRHIPARHRAHRLRAAVCCGERRPPLGGAGLDEVLDHAALAGCQRRGCEEAGFYSPGLLPIVDSRCV